ncbi:MAG TPA: DUF433 domain-containing protein [Candidatus Saccharimonadales bacterium]|nr:DUF433 domain-containing protein [Candidatus Saccharimonadales bacterium]
MSTAIVTDPSLIARSSDVCGGQPVVAGTRTPVKSIVGYYKMGMSVEEILEGLPHLTPAQVFAALSYYHAHQTEIEQDIETSHMETLVARYGLKILPNGRLIPEKNGE